MYRIGIIGAGSMADRHIFAYKEIPEAQVVAISARHLDSANQKADQYSIPYRYDDYRKMLAECQLDAVHVVTPNCTHAEATITALKAGVNVLCEKPPAMNAQQAIEMAECAKQSGKVLMYGLTARFFEKTRVVKDFQKENVFGDIYFVKTGCIRRCGNPGGWFSNKDMAKGGPMIDLGVHMLDLSMYLMGEVKPVSVYGWITDKVGARENVKGYSWYKSAGYSASSVNNVESMASCMIRFENGAALFCEVSFASHIEKETTYLELLGDKGGCTVEPGLKIYTEKADYLVDVTPVLDHYEIDWDEAVVPEVKHFIDCIAGRCECKAGPEVGITIMRVLDAVYQSAETGMSVPL